MAKNEKLNNFISGIIVFTDKLVNLYIYYVGIACLMSWIPNINPEYPLFHAIFKFAGFFLLPSIGGFIFAPLLIMTACVLISQGLGKLYLKLNKDKKPEIIILTPEEFMQKITSSEAEQKDDIEKTEKSGNPENNDEENKNDSV